MSYYSKFIDSTILKADASKLEIIQLCEEAIKEDFFSVCINPYYVPLAKKALSGSSVKVCTVVGFPLGQNTISTKVFETIDAINKGADEIDMVINIARLKARDFEYCVYEINQIKKVCEDKILKVIVETALLNEEDKINACNIVLKSDADFIKTSTGFSSAGAKYEDIILFNSIINKRKQIKAAGGIKNHQDLMRFIKAGANRIGTSSGKKLITENFDDDGFETY
ncbi:MAG: deoxyribose-phosphate aldolase [Mycoplasmoidaceae bacterium]